MTEEGVFKFFLDSRLRGNDKRRTRITEKGFIIHELPLMQEWQRGTACGFA
jgi:hypothetical protein